MIFSMTGYATGSQIINKETVVIEIRTLNSKFFDFSLRCPDSFFSLETEIKKVTQKTLKRGKVDVKIKKIADKNISKIINIRDLKTKMAHLKKITPDNSDSNLLQLALSIPRLNSSQEKGLTQKYQKEILYFFEFVLGKVIKFRQKEGKALYTELIKYLKTVKIELQKIKKRDKSRIKIKKQKLKSTFSSSSIIYDKTRLEQEILYYIEKMDITEEIVRLEHHQKYFLELMLNEDQIGKKINFLLQEMLREINTIGAKSNDFPLQKHVIIIKEELEKIKEQIQNVL